MSPAYITDAALQELIMRQLEPEHALTEKDLTLFIRVEPERVKSCCADLQQRGLIYSVDYVFWKLTVSGRMALKNGKEV